MDYGNEEFPVSRLHVTIWLTFQEIRRLFLFFVVFVFGLLFPIIILCILAFQLGVAYQCIKQRLRLLKLIQLTSYNLLNLRILHPFLDRQS